MKIQLKIAAIAFVVIATCVAMYVFIFGGNDFENVDQAYVKEHMVKPGFILLDTREARIFNGESAFDDVPGGHIPGAVNFPNSELKLENAAEELAKAGITKDTTVIVYCNKGRLSALVAEVLVEKFGLDRSKIKNYEGGMLDWSSDWQNPILPKEHAQAKKQRFSPRD